MSLSTIRPARMFGSGEDALSFSPEALLLATSLWWAGTANLPLLRSALDAMPAGAPATWGFAAALCAMLVGLHALLLGLLSLLLPRAALKPLLALLLLVTALASFYVQRLGVFLDPSMLRNVLRTDWAEASELLSPALVPHLLLYALLPAVLLARVRLPQQPWATALARRAALLLLALALLLVPLVLVFKPFASLMRSQRELRYLATPANVLWSSGAVLAAQARGAARPRQAIGTDAAAGPRLVARQRPLVLVMVVGETARAANWGLNGYARPTTPELARLPVINFPDVRACGTNTEVSLPCMFAPVGRRDYDEARIRGQQSLLHVLERAGVGVLWRDNQSGCKGVCEGLPLEEMLALNPAGLCEAGHCWDEALLSGLPQRLAAARGTQMLVLHMIGNHGPAYHRRYPPPFEHFKPACRDDDFSRCSNEAIVNAYDNALRYTDHVLASAIAQLQAASDRVDSVLLYVSDHGESLGENGLVLHGLPWAIAPELQKRVPMVMWFSPGAGAATGIDPGCLRGRAALPVAHDHLFHTVLGLLDVRTALHEPAWDLGTPCRAAAP